MRKFVWLLLGLFLQGCQAEPEKNYDLIIHSGTVYDGSGGDPYRADIGVINDRIAAIGDLGGSQATINIDASGKVVAPGFINMLSWGVESMIIDGRAQSDIRQGVTLEVFGEGDSWGPLNDLLKEKIHNRPVDYKYDIKWETLGEYLEYLQKKGVSTNVASFVGAATAREFVIGDSSRAPTAEELEIMQDVVRQAMKEGAMGVASALVYAPGYYAQTDELIALAKAAGEYGGMYISHMRSESNALLQAIDELIRIAREADVPAEIYHLKQAGRNNWGLLDDVVAKVEAARAEGLHITADMYTYTAGSTGLSAVLPPWVLDGGFDALLKRLRDQKMRQKIIAEMRTPSDEWEQFLTLSGAEGIVLTALNNPVLKGYTGKSLAEVARLRGVAPEEAAFDLLLENGAEIVAVFNLMSEENVHRQTALPWISFCSDSEALSAAGIFLKSMVHPRAYGSFARLLAKYVRDEKALSLQEAIRRMTSFPARNLKLQQRGELREGYYADIVVFDPAQIQDHATFTEPHQYATGVEHVLVNGTPVLRNGKHTGAMPGRVVRGPGWTGSR